jgi:hypothetical protein
MRSFKAALCTVMAAGLAVCVAASPASAATIYQGPIDQHYTPDGSISVGHVSEPNCYGPYGGGYACEVWYPTSGWLANGDPLITFGVGTNASPSDYSQLFTHLASLNFVVVATDFGFNVDGTQIYDAAQWVNTNFHNQNPSAYPPIDASKIGAMGHSQGAAGAINAKKLSNVQLANIRIKTVAGIEIPTQNGLTCGTSPTPCVSTVNFASTYSPGSLFLVNGSNDQLISPSDQPPGALGEQSNYHYWLDAATTDHPEIQVPKVFITLLNAEHNDITNCGANQTDCQSGSFNQNYFGYLTAWMMYALRASTYAQGAFTSFYSSPIGEANSPVSGYTRKYNTPNGHSDL